MTRRRNFGALLGLAAILSACGGGGGDDPVTPVTPAPATVTLSGEVAVVNLVRNDFVPELSQRLDDDITGAQIIINLRAEAPPECLEHELRLALAPERAPSAAAVLVIEHLEYFHSYIYFL